jgi:hypothetical protein
MNQTTWSANFKNGNQRFLTKRLWGAANEPPYFHHGLFTTLREAILAHPGADLQQRRAFESLSGYEPDAVIEFLKSLQVLPQVQGSGGRREVCEEGVATHMTRLLSPSIRRRTSCSQRRHPRRAW